MVFGKPNFRILPRPIYLRLFSIAFLVRAAQHFERFEQRCVHAVLPGRFFDHYPRKRRCSAAGCPVNNSLALLVNCMKLSASSMGAGVASRVPWIRPKF